MESKILLVVVSIALASLTTQANPALQEFVFKTLDYPGVHSKAEKKFLKSFQILKKESQDFVLQELLAAMLKKGRWKTMAPYFGNRAASFLRILKGSKRLETELVTQGLSHKIDKVIENSLYVLRSIKSKKALPHLAKVLTSRADLSDAHGTAFQAISLAAELATKKEVDLLKSLRRIVKTSSADIRIRAQAVRVLGKIGTNENAQLLAKIVSEPKYRIRVFNRYNLFEPAAKGIGKLGQSKGLNILLALLLNEKEKSAIRGHAAIGLGYSKQARFLPFLKRMLSDRHASRKLKTNALEGLILIEQPAARPAIMKFLRERNIRFDQKILEFSVSQSTLGFLNTLDALDPAQKRVWLTRIINDSKIDPPTRSAALHRFSGPNTLALTTQLLNDFQKAGVSPESHRWSHNDVESAVNNYFEKKSPKELAKKYFPSRYYPINASILHRLETQVPKKMTGAQLNEFLGSLFQRKKLRNPEIERCRALCDLFAQTKHWAMKDYFQLPYHGTRISWGVATRSLIGLFLLKAAPYCPGGNKIAKILKSQWFEHSPKFSVFFKKGKTTKLKSSLREWDHFLLKHGKDLDPESLIRAKQFMKLVSQSGDVRSNYSTAFYAKVFYATLVEELSRGETSPTQQTKLQHTLKDVRKLIASDLKIFDKAVDGYGGSVMNTYAVFVGVLAHPNIRSPLSVYEKKMEKSKTPFQLPYTIHHDFGTLRSAVARTVPYSLSQFLLNSGTRLAKDKKRKLLIGALENYIKFAPSLKAQILRTGTHAGTDALAPYYFYPTLPYASTATRALLMDGSLAPKQRLKVLEIQRQLFREMLSLRLPNGTFRPMGTLVSSTGLLSNAFAGLALLPLVEQCQSRSGQTIIVAPSLGILGRAFSPVVDRTRPRKTH